MQKPINAETNACRNPHMYNERRNKNMEKQASNIASDKSLPASVKEIYTYLL